MAVDSRDENFLLKKAVQFAQNSDAVSMDNESPEASLLSQITPMTLPNNLNHSTQSINELDIAAGTERNDENKMTNNLANRRFLRVKPQQCGSSFSSNGDKEYPTWMTSKEARTSLIAVLSSLYAMLLVILALAFEVSIVVVDGGNSSKYDAFYIYLYALALVFFGYCYAFLLKSEGWNANMSKKCCFFQSRTSLNIAAIAAQSAITAAAQCDHRMMISLKRKATHSAKSAGSLYLRLGCVVFGVIGLIDKGLRLFVAFDRGFQSSCFHGTTIAETFLTAAFIFVQMFFIFQNSKLVIHRFKSTGRLGTMHVIATNLCMWIRSLVEEEYAVIQDIKEGFSTSPRHNRNYASSDKLNSSISYSKSHCVDPLTGKRNELDCLISEIKPFMTTCIIEYSLICSAVMYILWRNIGHVTTHRIRQRKQRFHVDCSSSTKGLFLGLLFMVFTIVAMIIFFTKIRSEQNHAALWIFYAWDAILHVVSTLAVIVGILQVRRLHYVPKQRRVILLDDILLIVGLVGQLMYCVFSVVPLNNGSLTASMIVIMSLLRMIEVLLQTVFIIFGQRLAAMSQDKNPGRETITFLLLTNLSMFITNTFETQKAAANPLTSEFYGESIWTVIVHSTVPLSIFYRFHSTVCLAEIWKEAYRMKSTEGALLA